MADQTEAAYVTEEHSAYRGIKPMEKRQPGELSDEELAENLAANNAAIQKYRKQVSELAGGMVPADQRARDQLIASHVKNIEKLETENEGLREEWLRRKGGEGGA
jgi:hypothetical protein